MICVKYKFKNCMKYKDSSYIFLNLNMSTKLLMTKKPSLLTQIKLVSWTP